MRLPSGVVDYVHVGARFDGWVVDRISGTSVRIVKDGRSRVLVAPEG